MTKDLWHTHLSEGALCMTSSAIRDLLEVTEQPSIISFAGGLPAPEYFPVEELATAAKQALTKQPEMTLQYGRTEGYSLLRTLLAERMVSLDVDVSPEQILMTSGSQQALDMLGKLFIDPGTLVAVEEPTYIGALQAWRPYRPRFVALPMDDEGLDISVLELLLRNDAQVRFLYVVSSFQNPTSITLSLPRRRELLELAAQYSLLIIEDDPYGELYYNGERPKLLAAIDIDLHGELQHVVYISTFSKLLSPGLRVAWIAAPIPLMSKLIHAKQGLDLFTGSLAQAMVYEVCHNGLLDRHIPVIRTAYQTRRDVMLRALDQYMPVGMHWTRPSGGMFVWLTLPTQIDTTELLRISLEQLVAFVPGAAFFANGGGTNTMRLNFSHPAPEHIVEGISRLGRAIALQKSKQ